ncbi:glycosyltransferase family 2 protein [Mucisphaera calidilacus]|uniref:Rhamnosyltransferase WbbL n=1 Tax=Mucisphaera calidilacus TaxID=2527982 RepID=A0A518C185_9BACT|nr:glycosyltransferase family 2 protein [Mucisphaera calidilacus]QDU72982.1 Rhamnosyltransferase WbbL [Mucisphaera calidilacus]
MTQRDDQVQGSAPDTVTVIVNYRCAALTVDALRTVEPEVERYRSAVGGRLRVVVTDNASGDDSVEVLEQAREENGWGEWLTILPLPKNGGFAYGNNEGIRWADAHLGEAHYVHLLNPDTLIREGAVVELVRFMEGHGEAGFAGSRLEDPDGTVQVSAFRFPTVLSEFEGRINLGVVSWLLRRWRVAPPASDRVAVTDWVAGASLLVRRSVLERVGLLDEAYFMYYEEVDWIRQGRLAGFGCWYVPASRVVHLVGQVSGVRGGGGVGRARRTPEYVFEARRIYWLKNHGWLKKVFADAAVITGTVLGRLKCLLLGQAVTDPAYFLRDSLSFHLMGTYPERR